MRAAARKCSSSSRLKALGRSTNPAHHQLAGTGVETQRAEMAHGNCVPNCRAFKSTRPVEEAEKPLPGCVERVNNIFPSPDWCSVKADAPWWEALGSSTSVISVGTTCSFPYCFLPFLQEVFTGSHGCLIRN